MGLVLVDSSIWINFFKGAETSRPLMSLIDSNTVCVNDLILSELIPSMVHRGETRLRSLMLSIHRLEIRPKWSQVIEMQIANLKNGINRVGIADLLIAQNAMENDAILYSADRHFMKMAPLIGLRLFKP